MTDKDSVRFNRSYVTAMFCDFTQKLRSKEVVWLQTEVPQELLMSTQSVDYCTLKTSYREKIRKIFYQDIRE